MNSAQMDLLRRATMATLRFDLKWRRQWIGGLLGAAIAGACVVPAHAQTAQLNVRGSKQYVFGINVAWDSGNETNSIGHNPAHTDWGVNYTGSDWDTFFTEAKSMNCNVVRIWLFPAYEGCTFDSNGYVNGLDSTYLTNLDDIVSRAESHGLAIYFTCAADLDYNIGSPASSNGATIANAVTNSSAQSAFINNAIVPIVNRYKGKATIFGYEAFNEPEIEISNHSLFTMSQLRSYISAFATAVHNAAPGTIVTCDSTNPADFQSANFSSTFGGLGLDFYDLHSYTDQADIPQVSSTAVDKPLLLGEFGNSGGNNVTNETFSDDAFIRQAADRGLAGGFAWSLTGDTKFDVIQSGSFTTVANDIGYWGQQFGIGSNSYSNPYDYTSGYTFESGTQGWAAGGSVSSVSQSTGQVHGGSHSLAVNISASAGSYPQVYTEQPYLGAGQTITGYVWLPSNSNVTSINWYTQQGTSTGYQWTNAAAVTSLNKGGWTQVSYTLPAGVELPLLSLGLQFATSGADTETAYVDDISYSGGSTGGNPQFSVTSSYSPGTTVTAGASTTITANFHDTGGALSNGILAIQMYDSNNNQVGADNVGSENVSAGGTNTVTWTFNAPTTPGTYTIDAGAWNSNWGTNYLYTGLPSLTVVAGNPTPHSGSWEAKVSPGGNWNNLCQTPAVSQNTAYTSTFWLQGTGSIHYRVMSPDWSTQIVAGDFTPSSSSSWNQASLSFNSGGYSSVLVDFTDSSSGGTLYIDDVVVAAADGVNVVADGDFEQGSGQSAWFVQNPFSIVDPVNAGPPAAPSGLKATAGATGTKQIALSWAGSTGATSYSIYRGTTAGGESTTAIATGVTGTSYTNTGLTANQKYYYKIAAVSSHGTSLKSNEASATAK